MGIRQIKRLPSKIQELRKAKSLTQKQLAQALGLSEAMFSRIENGERTIQQSQIDILAKMLDADITELRSLSLADKMEAEAQEYTQVEIDKALKELKNK